MTLTSIRFNPFVTFLYIPDCDGWLGTSVASPSSTSPKDCGRSKSEEETACCEQRSITETVINGSMKETVSLTVDAKTETAVFKRFAKHIHTKKTLYSCSTVTVLMLFVVLAF